MKCREHERYGVGALTDGEFAAHCDTCPECRAVVEMDSVIETMAGAQPGPQPAPGLWDRIAADLAPHGRTADATEAPAEVSGPSADTSGTAARFWEAARAVLVPRRRPAWQFAAALVVVVGLPLLFLLRPSGSQEDSVAQNLLTAQALTRVEALEAEYSDAIADLEKVAGPALESADAGLRLRYRKRLEIIDDQILRCRAVLAQDRGNAHVRRYLMAAYEDKKETLVTILASVDARPAAGSS